MNGVTLADCALAYGPNTDRRCVWCGRALRRGSTYDWCSSRCEAAFVDAHDWARARAAAWARTAGRCQVCGEPATEVHHEEPTDTYAASCAHHAANLAVLCKQHHNERHRRLRAKPGTQLDLFVAA